jgi:anti-anti-sigma factor
MIQTPQALQPSTPSSRIQSRGGMLNVTIENSGNLTVLRFSGRLVFGEEISTLFNGVISQKNKRVVVLDLTKVNRIDACGLGILVFLKRWARGAGVKLQLIPSKTVQELLDLTGLHSLFEIRSSKVESASDVLVDSEEDSAIGIGAND